MGSGGTVGVWEVGEDFCVCRNARDVENQKNDVESYHVLRCNISGSRSRGGGGGHLFAVKIYRV